MPSSLGCYILVGETDINQIATKPNVDCNQYTVTNAVNEKYRV